MGQSTNIILMVRPYNFYMNAQTASNNYYQKQQEDKSIDTTALAQAEFDYFVVALRGVGIDVLVYQDTKNTDTPDSLFPNNWVSFHPGGVVVKYPMFAENRRLERSSDILEFVENNTSKIDKIISYTEAENESRFLEGTGSMVLDRVNRKAYCGLSPRTCKDLVLRFCDDMDYSPVLFTSNQTVKWRRMPIYHTNVMMSVASDFAMVCTDSIDDESERKDVIRNLQEDGKQVIPLSEDQIVNFAGNALEVLGSDDKRYFVMSSAAHHSLKKHQIESLQQYVKILHSPLDTIERLGGGSARCMMAEVHL